MARILIIDDDASVRALLTAIFMEQDHVVTEAVDGVQGLAMAKLNPPDAVVVDVDMPGLNGYEVCMCLRAYHATHLVPILMLTGTTDLTGAINGMACGASDHITKPFNVDEVAARVQALLLRPR